MMIRYRLYVLCGLLFLILCVFVSVAHAAINPQINYQGKLADTSGNAVVNGNYNLRFKLYTVASGGSAIWTETLCYSPDAGTTCNGTGTDSRPATSVGLFSVLLGSITSLSSVNFNQTLYLGVEVGGSGATPTWDGEMTPRKTVGSVASAFTADKLNGLSSSAFAQVAANNIFTGTNIFTAATTTALFSTNQISNTASFGATATSSFSSTGALSLATALTVPNGGTGATTFTSGSLIFGSGTGALQSVATSSVTSGAGISVSGGGSVIGAGGLSITNTGVTSNVAGAGVSVSGATGAVTINFAAPASSALSIPFASTTAITATTASSTNLTVSSVPNALFLGNGSGTATSYGGTSCTNQFSRSINGAGVATCASVSLTTDITGTLGLGNGGTATTTFQNGGVVFSDGSKLTQAASAAAFFWDNANNRLGLGTSTPLGALSIYGDTLFAGASRYANFGTTTGSTGYGFRDNAGTLEFKNQNGVWNSVNTATSGPSFSVNKGGTSQTVTGGVETLLTWSTKTFDTNNNFSTSNNRFTPTVPGKYLVTVDALCTGTPTICQTSIRKNGSVYAYSPYRTSSLDNAALVTTLVDMNGSTDYLEAYIYSTATNIDGTSAYSYFTGALIAPVSATSVGGNWTTDGTYTHTVAGQNVGVSSTTPWGLLSINPNGITGPSFVIGSSTATSFVVTNGGNVGIGTTSPASGFALDVGGTIHASSGYRTQTGNGGAYTGDVFNINWTGAVAQLWIDSTNLGTISVSSDERVKKNITSLATSTGLDAINALNPVTFNWRDPASGTSTQFGFIAQDVRNVLPDLVSNTGIISSSTPDGLLHLDYNGLFAPIVKAIQEIAAVSGTFKANLIAWLGSAGNGIGDFFAQRLCLTDASGNRTCMSEQQLAALLALQGATGSSSSSNSNANSSTSSPQATLTLNGYNLVIWQINTAWQDNLGALFSHDGQSETIYSTSTIDTSVSGTSTIDYWASIPSTQQWLHTRRTIVVQSPTGGNQISTSTPPADTSASSGTSATTSTTTTP